MAIISNTTDSLNIFVDRLCQESLLIAIGRFASMMLSEHRCQKVSKASSHHPGPAVLDSPERVVTWHYMSTFAQPQPYPPHAGECPKRRYPSQFIQFYTIHRGMTENGQTKTWFSDTGILHLRSDHIMHIWQRHTQCAYYPWLVIFTALHTLHAHFTSIPFNTLIIF